MSSQPNACVALPHSHSIPLCAPSFPCPRVACIIGVREGRGRGNALIRFQAISSAQNRYCVRECTFAGVGHDLYFSLTDF